MNNKNSSQDFAIKKEFINLQLEVRKFMDEAEFFTLNDMLKDPHVVHSFEDYVNAYKELDDIKRIKKTLRKLQKFKQKGVDLFPALQLIEKPTYMPVKSEVKPKILFKNNFNPADTPFSLKAAPIERKLTNENMLQIFKSHFKRIALLKKIQLPKINVSRNFTVSTSHSHLFKKIEKGAETISPKASNEIKTNSSFRNGIMRNQSPTDKGPSQGHQSTSTNTTPKASRMGVVKATRSPYQSISSTNPHEALLTPVQKDNISSQESLEKNKKINDIENL
ncbi:hypothetical protein GINT2_000609 [Glugoides intestinalis]